MSYPANNRVARGETLVVAGVLLCAFVVGAFAGRQFAGQPRFYQSEFGPAVMLAAGRGLVSPLQQPGAPLAEFLAVRRQTLEPADFADVAVGPLNQFQQAHRYLLLAVGVAWRLSGIAWANVATVSAVLFALSIAACYGICRLWLTRTAALAGAAFLTFSPTHLEHVPLIRDYAKAPFILIAILLTMVIAVRSLSRRMLWILSAACGLTVGVGLGFRMDVVVMAPIFLVSLFAFTDRRPWSGLGTKGIGAGVFLIALAAAAAPVVFLVSRGGSNGYHAILLGYADQFDAFLGIKRSVYSYLPYYSDDYLIAAVNRLALKNTGQIPPVPSPAYDDASRMYWLQIIRHFPADILTRTLAAANTILNLPFDEGPLNFLKAPGDHGNPLWNLLTNQVPHRARIGVVFEWMTVLNGLGLVFGIVLVAAAAVRSLRLGLFTAWMIVVLAGYASLQFDRRHFFHLEILPVLAVLVAIELLARRSKLDSRAIARFGGAVAILAAVLVVSSLTLRAYQQRHVGRLLQDYVDAPRQPVQAVFTDTGNGTWRARWAAAPAANTVAADYYVVEFDGAPKPEMSPLGVRYSSTTPDHDFSRVIWISEGDGVNRVFIPTYGEPPAWGFDGVELSAGIKARLRGIYRVTNPERLPLLLDLRLPGAWQQDHLTQTFRLRDAGLPDDVQMLGAAGGTAESRIALLGRVDSADAKPRAADVGKTYTNAVRLTEQGIEVDGLAEMQSSYLLELKPVSVTAPATLLVRGHLYQGGIVFGLLKGDSWYRSFGTGTPGDFVSVVDITEPGVYTPIVTNATARDHDRNRFLLSRFAVVPTILPR